MDEFPEFMKQPANRVAASDQATPGVEGYVFDGVDGSQMAFWTCHEAAVSAPHVHDYDEYMVVVQGCCTLIIDGKRIPSGRAANPSSPRDSDTVARPRGTTTIHAFGGRRAERAR